MDGLLAVERMIVESLEKKQRSLCQIHEDTGLSQPILVNLLSRLVERGILFYQKGEYRLATESQEKWLSQVNHRDNIKEEVNEIFGSVIDKTFEDQGDGPSLRMQKIWLTERENKILQAQLKNIELFIQGIRQQRRRSPQKEVTKEKTVVFWGQANYQKVVSEALGA